MPFVSAKSQRELMQTISPYVDAPDSSFFDTFAASVGTTIDEDLMISSGLNKEMYQDRRSQVSELIKSDQVDREIYTDRRGKFDYDRLANDRPELGIKNSNVLAEERNKLLADRRSYAEDVISRGNGMAQFLGAANAYMLDPINIATVGLATAPLAAKSMSVVGRALMTARNEAALNAVVELGIQPLVYEHKSNIDSPYAVEDAIKNIAFAAGGGAVLGGTVGGIAGYIGKVMKSVETLDVITPEVQASYEYLARMQDTINAGRTDRETYDSVLNDYDKFQAGEYDSYVAAAQNTIKESQTAIDTILNARGNGVSVGEVIVEQVDIPRFNTDAEKISAINKIETGEPVKAYYLRNEQSGKDAAPAGMDFGQDIEPSGEYINFDFSETMASSPPDGWSSGVIEFQNPLILEHKSTSSTGWKKDLSDMFDGKTGKELTQAIKDAGYDGVITKDADGFNETVNIAGKKIGLEPQANVDAPTESLEEIKSIFSDLKVGIRETEDNIIIDKIIVPDDLRNVGVGTAFMDRVIKYSDSTGKTIGLTPSADFGGNVKRLKEFYKRFGFVDNKGKNKDFAISETMIRVAPEVKATPKVKSAGEAKALDKEVAAKIDFHQKIIDDFSQSQDEGYLADLYAGARQSDIESDMEFYTDLEARKAEANKPSKIPSDYLEPPRTKPKKAMGTDREREILNATGMADDFDADMDAYSRIEKPFIIEDGEMVEASNFMKDLDNDIKGIESVLVCARG